MIERIHPPELPEAVRHSLQHEPRLRYTRKSTEEADKQIGSHEEQHSQLEQKFGSLPDPTLWFADNYTGTTFDRPAFRRLEAFCRLNPQPESKMGSIELYDMTRLGRLLDGQGREDPLAVLNKMKQFENWGWVFRFVMHDFSSHDSLMWLLQGGLLSWGAAATSRVTSAKVSTGLRTWASKGRWVFGDPPFGMVRTCPESGRVLEKGERISGKGGVLLAPDPDRIRYWPQMAEMLLNGSTYDAIADFLEKEGVPTLRGGRWNYVSVQAILRNTAYVGKLTYTSNSLVGGRKETETFQACWPPVVDEELFARVQREINRRRRNDERGPRTRAILDLRCHHCGARYSMHNCRREAVSRYYVHPAPTQKIKREIKLRIRQKGCKSWSVDVDTVQDRIAELIAHRCAQNGFRDDLRASIESRVEIEVQAERGLADAQSRLQQKKKAQMNLLHLVEHADDDGVKIRALVPRLAELETEIHEATEAVETARRLKGAASDAWGAVEAVLGESNRVFQNWHSATDAEKLLIFRWWVARAEVLAEQKVGAYHASAKRVLIHLWTAPTCSHELVYGKSLVWPSDRTVRCWAM